MRSVARLSMALAMCTAFPLTSFGAPPRAVLSVEVTNDATQPLPVVVQEGTNIEVGGAVTVEPGEEPLSVVVESSPGVQYTVIELDGFTECEEQDDSSFRCPFEFNTSDYTVPDDKVLIIDYVSYKDDDRLRSVTNGGIVTEIVERQGPFFTHHAVIGQVGECPVLLRCMGANTTIYVMPGKTIRARVTYGTLPQPTPPLSAFRTFFQLHARLVDAS